MYNRVYIVTLYRGENANEVNENKMSDNYIGFKDRVVMSIWNTKEKATKLKERFQEKANENGFGDEHKYFVETWVADD